MVGGLRKVVNLTVMGQVTELCELGAHPSGRERYLMSSTQLVPVSAVLSVVLCLQWVPAWYCFLKHLGLEPGYPIWVWQTML